MALKRWMRRLPPLARRDERIERLQDQLRQSRSQNATLRERQSRLKDQNATLRERQSRLKSQNAELRARRSPSSKAAGPSADQAAELIRESGLFDEGFYTAQVDRWPGHDDPVTHYLAQGQAAGLSPHPGFVPDWYQSQYPSSLAKTSPIRTAPLLHYLTTGAAKGVSPHPLFDAARYLARHPESARAPGGPVAHFLASGAQLTEATGGTGTAWDDPADFLAQARATAAALHESRGFTHLERDVSEFDLDHESAVKRNLTSLDLPDQLPLVSVVLPTKDRAATLPAAIDSVLSQTYPHLELIVVDDGSQDATHELLERYARDDDRLVVIEHERPGGVAAARNAALQRATGKYIAYLDSDNTWFPDFVEFMVRHLESSDDRAAYAVSVLAEEGGKERLLYRGQPFDREHLRERNYIDCIVLVHERTLLDDTGGFDESLRRNVDWELMIRLAELTDFTLVPIRGTQYDPWSATGERITTHEPMAYRFIVRQRSLVDLEALRDVVGRRSTELLSVVTVLTETMSAETVLTGVRRMLETAGGPIEIVVVDSRSSAAVFTAVHAGLSRTAGVQVHRLTQALTTEVARNVGVQWTSGAQLAFLPATVWTEPGWDRPLREALERYRVVQPLVLTRGGAVWSAGVEYLEDGHSFLPWMDFAGDAPEIRQEREVTAVSAAALAVSAVDFLDSGGFNPLIRNDDIGGELSLRITAATTGTAACVPGSVLAWRKDPTDPNRTTTRMRVRINQRVDRERWSEIGRPHRPVESVLPGYALAGFEREQDPLRALRPVIVHNRPTRPLRWAIKIGAPTVDVRRNWGDWHFAESLRASLERLGHEVTIDSKEAWYRPTAHLDDVVLQMRGVSSYEVTPGHTNILWVISHPERVRVPELADYDLAFGASPRWCATMTARLGRPIEPMLQCTDPQRFHPMPPDPRRSHDVLVVANARGIRPSVQAALEAGIVPAVYGVRWQDLLPPGAWRGSYIPNDELASVYASAGVVLNDHWDDMREHGILSNRLFDLAACDARVVTDYLPEVEEVFGDVVLTYGEGRSIGEMVQMQLHETPERAQARRDLGERVRREHTFDARAARLSEAVERWRARTADPRAS